jgi:hypothetical protein
MVSASTFDPKLLDVVGRLNKDAKVRVNTLVLVRRNEVLEGQMKEMARRNKGMYKFVSASDLNPPI